VKQPTWPVPAQLIRGFPVVRLHVYNEVIGLARELATVAQKSNNEGPTAGAASAGVIDASRRKPLPFGWLLFTTLWLLFPAGFVVQVLRTDLSPVQLLALLVSLVVFIAVFLWLMLRYPFPTAELAPQELRIRIGLLLVLAAIALYVELVYGSGIPYRFMYVVIAAAVTLPTGQAACTVVAVTVGVSAFYALRLGWEAAVTSWSDVVPFLLIGIGMIAVSRLVVTIRELRAAREEIARLAVAEERLRFARDLHDLLGHSLSSITLKSELAGRLLPAAPEKAAAEVHDIEEVARKALREVREAVAGYRQPTLGGELDGAREMLKAAGIACHIEQEVGVLPNATDAVLAWAVREGVTNVIRHSRARLCQVRLARDGEEVRAEISDDGLGSPPEHEGSSTGSGLSGLAERVAANGGDFHAGPLPEGGFRLRVSLPLGGDEAPTDNSISNTSEHR
jgi:two-component system, NarL family, sensor histidine kinase DesK